PEKVIIKALVVRVDLGATLVAHALVPGASGVHALVFPAPTRFEGFARHHLVVVARQIVDAEIADALGLTAAAHALPQSGQLFGITLRHLLHVRAVPGHVAVALVRVAHVAIRKRLHFGTLTSERPLALRAQTFAHGSALDLRLIEAIHHFGALTLLVGPSVRIDAKALLDLFSYAAAHGLELLAHRFLIGLVVPTLFAIVLDLGAVLALDQLHTRRAG